jgi:ABC-2 type transport system permease protein
LTLYLKGSTVNAQTESLLQTASLNYTHTLVNPQPPITINTILINPPSSANVGVMLGQVYTPLVLLLSLTVGISFIPLMLLDEKEKKTLRLLLVTPASFGDILVGKLLVVLFFQITITYVLLAIQSSFSVVVPLVTFYEVIGSLFSLSLGLFFSSVFNTSSSAGAISGFMSIILILGGGPLLVN